MAEMFLILPDIRSDLRDSAFLGALPLHTVNWGLNLVPTSPGEFGPVRMNEIVVSKSVDRTSPQLMQALNDKTSWRTGRIAFRHPGDPATAHVYLFIDLVDARLIQVAAQSSSGTDIPTEQLTLMFRAATWTYRRRNADGTYSVLSSFTWEAPPEGMF
jgi:type VI protein secretion system component Hcp